MEGGLVLKMRGMGFYERKNMSLILLRIAAYFVCTLLASIYSYRLFQDLKERLLHFRQQPPLRGSFIRVFF
jgi:hypothetical protein